MFMANEVTELEELLASYRKANNVDDFSLLGSFLLDHKGKELGARLFEVHAGLLAPILRAAPDLKALRNVLLDAKAHAELLGKNLSDILLTRYVAAVTAPEKTAAEFFPAKSAFADQVRKDPHLLGRLVAGLDDRLLKALRTAFPKLEPFLRKVRDIEAFAALPPLLADNPDVEPEGFLAAIPDIASAAGLTTGVQAFQFARELVKAKNRLVDRDDWFPKCLDAVAVVHPSRTPRFAIIAEILPYAPLVKHCLHVHDLSWDSMCHTLRNAWDRVRTQFPTEKEAMCRLEEIFAREMPTVTTIPFWGSLCLAFPEGLAFSQDEWKSRLHPPAKESIDPDRTHDVVLALLEITQGMIDAVSVIRRFDTLREAEAYLAQNPVRSSGHGWTGRSEYALLCQKTDGYYELDGTRLTYPRDDTLRFG